MWYVNIFLGRDALADYRLFADPASTTIPLLFYAPFLRELWIACGELSVPSAFFQALSNPTCIYPLPIYVSIEMLHIRLFTKQICSFISLQLFQLTEIS